MSRVYIKVLVFLAVLTVVLYASGTFLFKSVAESYYIAIFPYLLLFFFIVNAAVHFFKHKIFKIRAASFPRHLMAINGLKIFSYVLFIMVYLFLFRENAKPFLIGFLFLYFIYFSFELLVNKFYK